MKPRQKDETDAHYISRLEQQNASLKSNNEWLTRQNSIFVSRARPAAIHLGAVFHAAAEACGMTDDPQVISCVRTFEALSGIPWAKDIPMPDTLLRFNSPDPARNGGDCEMVLRSAYEMVATELASPTAYFDIPKGIPENQRRWLWSVLEALVHLARANLTDQIREAALIPERQRFDPPPINDLNSAREYVETLWWEVSDVLSDVEMSRAMLRLDLRSCMYDNAFRRIGDALRRASSAVDALPRPEHEDDGIPL